MTYIVSTTLADEKKKALTADGRLAVSLPEAAAMSGLSRRTLENYARLKILPVRKIGTRTLVLLRDLEKFLQRDQPSVGRKCPLDARERTQ
jgi:hypothetical protein